MRKDRPILVSWVYPDSNEAFVERILATPEEEARLRRYLNIRRRNETIYDLYIGPEQSVPTPFEEFWYNLETMIFPER
jgi:hypothetical protein